MPQINKMIVHNLNLGNERPIFSDRLINLDQLDRDNDALEFFREHITNNRSQSYTKQCRFNDNTANHIRISITELHEIYHNNTDEFDNHFIDKSIIITDHLATSMRGKSRSDGAVFIFLYTHNNTEHLGILKMDPNLGIQVNDDLTLTVRNQMLPSTREKLHKSAFIKFKEEFLEDETHLFVLDRQQSRDEPAKYFMHDFLYAEERANDDNLTVAFEKEIKSEVIQYIEAPRDRSIFNSRLKTKLSDNELFNLDEDLPQLTRGLLPEDFALDQLSEDIKGKILNKFPDAVFQIVPNPEKVKDSEFKSDDQSVIIKIKGNMPDNLYSYEIDDVTGESVFRFSGRLNVIPRG